MKKDKTIYIRCTDEDLKELEVLQKFFCLSKSSAIRLSFRILAYYVKKTVVRKEVEEFAEFK